MRQLERNDAEDVQGFIRATWQTVSTHLHDKKEKRLLDQSLP